MALLLQRISSLCWQFQFRRICFTRPAYFSASGCSSSAATSSAAMHINGGQWQVVCYAAVGIRLAIRKWSTRDSNYISLSL